MAFNKIPKVVAAYLPAKYVGTDGGFGTSCSKCRDFLKSTSECVILIEPKVNGPKGTCVYYLYGIAPAGGRPLHLIPKKVAGYIEGPDVPTYCGRCEYYSNSRSRTAECYKVGDYEGDMVEYGGCCASYSARNKSAPKENS